MYVNVIYEGAKLERHYWGCTNSYLW